MKSGMNEKENFKEFFKVNQEQNIYVYTAFNWKIKEILKLL